MKKKSIFWGLILILLAVFIIVSQLGYLPDLPVTKLILAGILGMISVKGIFELNFFEMLVPASIIACLYDKYLGITKITPWPIIVSAVLVSIGLNMIFGGLKKKRKVTKIKGATFGKDVENCQDGSVVNVDNSFGDLTKYINANNLTAVNADNAFGHTRVFFDNAVIAGGKCVVNAENAFGDLELFFPRQWKIEVIRECAFGKIKCDDFGSVDPTAPVVIVNASCSFGKIDIHVN